MASFSIKFYSQELGMNTQMEVIIPQAVSSSWGKGDVYESQKIKTLYLLHGHSDCENGWKGLTSIERYAREMGVAVVMPFAHNSWYCNMKYGFKYFDFVAKELPKICRYFFPQMSAKREDNIIAGNSMGGYGALKIALRCPETFGYVGCLSGAFNANEIVNNINIENYFEAVFGGQDEYENSENDVFSLVKNFDDKEVKKPPIFMWCGKQDGIVGLYNANEKMYKLLKEKNYDVTYSCTDGTHSWDFWDLNVKKFLEWYKQKTNLEITQSYR